jgi:hypothetical protein
MNPPTTSRKQQALELVREIRRGVEEFFRLGLKLKRLRDERLYAELGYQDYLSCCRGEFDFEHSRVYQLIQAAEYRAGIPDSTNGGQEWSERSIRELTRIADKGKAAEAAAEVLKAVQESEKQAASNPDVKPLKLTAATVRKFIDTELGVNRVEERLERWRSAPQGDASGCEVNTPQPATTPCLIPFNE